MKKISLLILSAFAAAAAFGQPTIKLTLSDCMEYALTGNYSRQSVALSEDAQEQSVKQAKGSRLPDLSANLSENFSNATKGGTSWNGSYDVSTSVTIFQGGQINNAVRQSELQLAQTKEQIRQYDNDLIIQVLQAYLTALGNEELLLYQQAVLETSGKQVLEGRAKYQAGQIIESDYMLLEAQYASDLDNITSTRITLENNLLALKKLMSMPLSENIEIVAPEDAVMLRLLDIPSREEVVERGMETLPDVKISDYSVEIAESGVRISRSSYAPTLSANASAGTGHSSNFSGYGTQLSDRFGQSAGVSLSIPILNRNRTKTAVAQSRIALQQAELDRKQSLLNIEQTLINEYGNVVASSSRYRAANVRKEAYAKSLAAYTEMFRAGSITAVELLQQQNNYIGALNDYIQAKYTFMMQRNVLDVYMGDLFYM